MGCGSNPNPLLKSQISKKNTSQCDFSDAHPQEHPLWAGATFSLWCLLRMRSDPARRGPGAAVLPSVTGGGKTNGWNLRNESFLKESPIPGQMFRFYGIFWGLNLQRTIRLSSLLVKGDSYLPKNVFHLYVPGS